MALQPQPLPPYPIQADTDYLIKIMCAGDGTTHFKVPPVSQKLVKNPKNHPNNVPDPPSTTTDVAILQMRFQHNLKPATPAFDDTLDELIRVYVACGTIYFIKASPISRELMQNSENRPSGEAGTDGSESDKVNGEDDKFSQGIPDTRSHANGDGYCQGFVC